MVYNFKDDMILCGVDNINLFDELSEDVSFKVDIFIGNHSYWMEIFLCSWNTALKYTSS